MKRPLLILSALLFVVPRAGAEAQPGDTVVLTLRPARPPRPALKYVLLPELRDQTEGNAALHYYRAALLRGKEDDAAAERASKWADLPPRDLPREEVRAYLGRYRGLLREVEAGARCSFCNWNMQERLRREGLELWLPEIQQLREFARLLRLRARLEIAEGQLDQALATLQTNFAMARHAADEPVLISALVGVAIATQSTRDLEEWVQAPDAANLYWTLAALPSPFIDVRRAMQGERLWVTALFPGLGELAADARQGPLEPSRLRAIQDRLARVVATADGGGDWQFKLLLAAGTAKLYPDARRYLLSQGRTAEQVEAFPMVQAVFLYLLAEYDRVFDDTFKWFGLPYWQARPGLLRAEQYLATEGRLRPELFLPRLLLPAVSRVSLATARVERQLTALRCVEAIRLHAAGHDGRLPDSLAEITEVPVPLDPVTGKPFEYRVEGDRAELFGPPPANEPAKAYGLRYELRLAR